MKLKLIVGGAFLIVLLVVVWSSGLTNQVISNEQYPEQLTQEQKLEDFRYMYQIFQEYYPNFWDIKEYGNYDWLAMKSRFEQIILNTESDEEFYYKLKEIVDNLKDVHTLVISPEVYFGYFFQKFMHEDTWADYKPWQDALLNGHDPYVYWHKLLNGIEFNETQMENQDLYSVETILELNILEEGLIAYIKIKSFGIDARAEITTFLQDVKDYPYLVIDIIDNGGGSVQNWQDVFSNLLEPGTLFEIHSLARGMDFLDPFFESEYLSNASIEGIENYPGYAGLPEYIRDNFSYYVRRSTLVEPTDPIDFEGEIYLLVNGGVYSSAEVFAYFCQQTGFATLVGSRTGGAGLGIQSLYFSLPNSGLLVSMEALLGLNPDGSNNNFIGTQPDIMINRRPSEPYGETVLRETIQLIKVREEQKR